MSDEQTRKVIKFYEKEAPVYDVTYTRPNDRVYDEITWRFTEPYLPKRGVVLDAGGGAGGWAIEIAKKGLKVVLYDLSPDMLKEAEKKMRRYGLSDLIEIKQGDIRDMPFPDNRFDFVFCEADPISYCGDPYKAVGELARVLKPRGFMIAGVENTYFRAFRALRNGQPLEEVLRILKTGVVPLCDENSPFNVQSFTTTQLTELFNRHGLDIVKFVGKPTFISALPYDVQDDIFKSEEKIRRLFEIEHKICDDPSTVGIAGHIHVIARKRK